MSKANPRYRSKLLGFGNKTLCLLLAKLITVLSPILLAFVYYDHRGVSYRLSDGPTVLFVLSVTLVLLTLFMPNQRELYRWLLLEKYFQASLVLLLLGLYFSGTSIDGLKTFAIIAGFCASFTVAGILLNCKLQTTQPNNLPIVLGPYMVPVLLAFFMEMNGPIEFGVLLENSKHTHYEIPRWFFLHSSANGFGMSAAILSFGSYVCMHSQKRNALIVVWLFMFIAGVLATLLSGTRAAIIFLVFCMSSYELIFCKGRLKKSVTALVAGSLGIVCLLYFNNQYLPTWRISMDLVELSGNRFQGWTALWQASKQAHFLGIGFGIADSDVIKGATNMFYLATLLEIGVLGLCGSVLLLSLTFFTLKHFQQPFNGRDFNQLEKFAICFSISIFPYQIFEFDLLRVSSNTNLYFLCFGILLARLPFQNTK